MLVQKLVESQILLKLCSAKCQLNIVKFMIGDYIYDCTLFNQAATFLRVPGWDDAQKIFHQDLLLALGVGFT